MFDKVPKILFVVAHPDDETLMGGGLISKGIGEFGIVTIASDASARSTGSGSEKIASKQQEVFKHLGISKMYNYGGEDSNIINENHLKCVQFIEKCILDFNPDIIITHYPGDTHSDHRCVSLATQEAFRIKQRPLGKEPLKELWYGEVPSSTDWTMQTQFHPNVWVPLSTSNISDKIRSLKMYDQVLRPVPHSRSEENIDSLARVRGAQCGHEYAEAFQQVFRVYS